MTKIAVWCFLSSVGFGQIAPNVFRPTNLDFHDGVVGQIPLGWDMAATNVAAGYRAELRQDGCGRFSACVAIMPPSTRTEDLSAVFTQTFPAEPYIGKAIRLSAWLRFEPATNTGYVHIRMRVNYADGHTDMLDSVAKPVRGPQWQRREVLGHVNAGAQSIGIWARYVASGRAWIAAPAFETMDDPETPPMAIGVALATFRLKDAAGKTIRFGAWIKTENVTDGYAGVWWRVDGEEEPRVLAFDNSRERQIGGKAVESNGTMRGSSGTSDWTWHEIELPVAKEAHDIVFGFLLTGKGRAWFDKAKVELNGELYNNPAFDFDFESPELVGFRDSGSKARNNPYYVVLDPTVAYTGRQSLRLQYAQPTSAAAKDR